MDHTRFLYEVARYAEGKKTGSPMPLDTWAIAREEAREAARSSGLPIIEVPWNQRVPADATGLVIEEIRMRYAPGLPLSGVRVFA